MNCRHARAPYCPARIVHAKPREHRQFTFTMAAGGDDFEDQHNCLNTSNSQGAYLGTALVFQRDCRLRIALSTTNNCLNQAKYPNTVAF